MNYAPSDNPVVNTYLDSEVPEAMLPLFLDIRQCVLEANPGFKEDIKWKNCLVYAMKKNAIQTVLGKDKVTLIFFEGAQLDDPTGMLEGEGKKTRSARISDVGYDHQALAALVKQAAELAS